MNAIRFDLSLQAIIGKEGDLFVASFPAFDLFSQGATKEEAERNLIEAAQLFIESSFMRGAFQAVLNECGFEPMRGPHLAGAVADELRVPIELIAARNGQKNHADCG